MILLCDPFIGLAEVENEAMEMELDLQDKQSELATLKAQAQQLQSGKSDCAEGSGFCLPHGMHCPVVLPASLFHDIRHSFCAGKNQCQPRSQQ